MCAMRNAKVNQKMIEITIKINRFFYCVHWLGDSRLYAAIVMGESYL